MNVIAPHDWSETLGPERANEPARIGTLGALLKSGRGLTATCEVCLHSSRLDIGDLTARLGMFHASSETALRPKLQCSVCKSTEAVLQGTRPRRHPATRPAAAPKISAYV